MLEFDPIKHGLNIHTAYNGIIVECGCSGPAVFTSYKAFERELRGFLKGNLGPVGRKIWEDHAKRVHAEMQPSKPIGVALTGSGAPPEAPEAIGREFLLARTDSEKGTTGPKSRQRSKGRNRKS